MLTESIVKKVKADSGRGFLIYFAGILFLLLFIAAPGLSYGKPAEGISTAGIRNNGKTIKIAVVLPTEGRLAYFGRQFINGLSLSLNNPYGSKIRYIIVNLPVTAGDADIAELFASLVKKRISAIVGPVFAEQLKYFAYNSVKFKIPVITPSPLVTREDASPFVFSYGMTLKQEIKAEIKYAKYTGINPISVIYPDSGYGQKVFAYIKRYSAKYDINMLNAAGYNDKTVDFFYNFNSLVRFKNTNGGHVSKAEKAQLGITPYNLMHGITKEIPDIPFRGLFVIGSPSKLKLILTQLMYYNIKGFSIFGLSTLDSKSFIEKYAFYMQNAIFPDGFFKDDDRGIVKRFVSAYRKYYGEPPNILSAEGYDIGGILARAAETRRNGRSVLSISGTGNQSVLAAPASSQQTENQSTHDANSVLFYNAILNIRFFKGVCGDNRLVGTRFKKSLYLFKYRNNNIYILESPF